jgi:hypothetical protein
MDYKALQAASFREYMYFRVPLALFLDEKPHSAFALAAA